MLGQETHNGFQHTRRMPLGVLRQERSSYQPLFFISHTLTHTYQLLQFSSLLMTKAPTHTHTPHQRTCTLMAGTGSSLGPRVSTTSKSYSLPLCLKRMVVWGVCVVVFVLVL